MNKKISNKYRGYLKKLKRALRKPCVWTVLILVLPLIIGLIYSLPIKQIIAVSSGDLLSYYGVAIGIIFTWMLYIHEDKKKDSIRKRNLTPTFEVKVNKDENNYFNIKLINYSKEPLSSLFLYDEFVSEYVKKTCNLQPYTMKRVK